MAIKKPKEHDIDFAGRRLLRAAIEPLGWAVNETERDYGIDYNIQVFNKGVPSGVWFHVQLKSSKSSRYSADREHIFQTL